MAQTGKPRSGKNGRFSVNGTTINATQWQVAGQADFIDVTNFETQGYSEGVFGIFTASVSIELYWNAAQNPFDNPPALKQGQLLEQCKLFVNLTDTTHFNFPYLAIVTCTLATPVRGVVTYSIQAQSDGPWTEPTGNA